MQKLDGRVLDEVIEALREIGGAGPEEFEVGPHVPAWIGPGVCAVCGKIYPRRADHPVPGPALGGEAEYLYALERQS
jgi:hypothetical protein